MSNEQSQMDNTQKNLAEHREIDVDGNGRSDYDELLDMEADEKAERQKQKSKLKKRDVTYNPATLAKEYFFGTDEREID